MQYNFFPTHLLTPFSQVGLVQTCVSCIGHRGYTPTWSFPYLSSLHLSTSLADYHLHFGFRVLALSSFPHSPDTRLLSSHSTQPGSLKIITMILALDPFLPVSADDICKFNLLFFYCFNLIIMVRHCSSQTSLSTPCLTCFLRTELVLVTGPGKGPRPGTTVSRHQVHRHGLRPSLVTEKQ